MNAIIWGEPTSTSEVLRIELLSEETVFHLADGQVLRVGEAPQNRMQGIPGIDLSAPPSTQHEIFYKPFMPRTIYDVVWPIVGSHPKIQKALRGHPRLQSIAQLSYDELRQLPLEAYVSGPFGLYLGHPFNFASRAPDYACTEAKDEYGCDFRDGDYLVNVSINLKTRAVRITQ